MKRSRRPARSSLSHVEERLRERALPSAADRGFMLLRSRERLRGLLARAATDDAGLAACERLALPLGPGAMPARLIVERDGAGVTCLAPEMASTAPELPWALVQAWLDEERRLFRAQVEAQRPGGPTHTTPLGRAFLFPWRITRAEMDALETLAPLFIDLARENIVYAGEALAVLRTRPMSLTDESAGSLWQLYAGAAVWLMACRREPDAVALAYALLANAHDVHLTARALWILVADPDRTFERTPEIAKEHEVLVGSACRYVLPAIALRHPARARDAARAARALLERAPIADASDVEAAILSMQDGREVLRALLEEHGEELAGSEAACWAPLAEIGATPRMDAKRAGVLIDDERASAAVWRRVLAARELPLLLPDDPFFPLLAALVPLEALLPLDEPDPAWRRSEGIAYVRGPLARMVRITTLADLDKTPQRRAAKEPGRNEPCPCGSGKKYKHCHGKAA